VISCPRVLIIDRDRRTVDRLQEQFTRFGYEAEVALSGHVGVSIVAERRMSVAVLSAALGHESDWALVRRLKKSDPAMPVVCFNGPKVKGLSREAKRAGVTKLLVDQAEAETVMARP